MKRKPVIEEEGEEPESFIKAKAGFELFGQPLRAFSASRKVAANCMGVLYPNIGIEGFEILQRTNSYPGALRDTISVLWLCQLPDPHELTIEQIRSGEWTPTRAIGKPGEAFEGAMAWAEREKLLDMQDERYQEAYKTFIGIVSNVEAAKFAVQDSAARGEPEESTGKV